jgi:hypothetical protein
MEMTASDWPTITIRSHGKIFSYIILSTFLCLSAFEGIVYTVWWMWYTLLEAQIYLLVVGGDALLRASPPHTCKHPFSLNLATSR